MWGIDGMQQPGDKAEIRTPTWGTQNRTSEKETAKYAKYAKPETEEAVHVFGVFRG